MPSLTLHFASLKCSDEFLESLSEERTHWLSFSFLGEVKQSDEFILESTTNEQMIDQGFKFDDIDHSALKDLFPVKAFLCSAGSKIVAGSEITYDSNGTQIVKMERIPDKCPIAYINVKLETSDDADESVGDSSDDYDDEKFENENASDTDGQTGNEETLVAETDEHIRPRDENANEFIHKELQSLKTIDRHERIEDDRKMRHYRVSINVRSIKNLQRPVHLSLHFMYPYLGATAPVRTAPKFYQQNSEQIVDGAVASYNCPFTREQFRATLALHPLTITALAKSHLGNTVMGSTIVNLAAANDIEPNNQK